MAVNEGTCTALGAGLVAAARAGASSRDAWTAAASSATARTAVTPPAIMLMIGFFATRVTAKAPGLSAGAGMLGAVTPRAVESAPDIGSVVCIGIGACTEA
jgi:hypothetical protein